MREDMLHKYNVHCNAKGVELRIINWTLYIAWLREFSSLKYTRITRIGDFLVSDRFSNLSNFYEYGKKSLYVEKKE